MLRGIAGAILLLAPAHARSADVAPQPPLALEAQPGDGAIGLSWRDITTPAPRDIRYSVEIDPPQPRADVYVAGTRALVRGLTNGSRYTFTVRASTAGGQSEPTTVQATPSAVTVALDSLPLEGDTESPSGAFDPSIVQTSDTERWLAYSGVDYSTLVDVLIQDVSTQLAHSTDGGRTYTHTRTIGAAGPATIDNKLGLGCDEEQERCSGRWVYETPALVDDASDPDPQRRWKLFAHKYFLYPPKVGRATIYALGSIVMWTAPAPDALWSSEQSVLGWNLTPRELRPKNNVNGLHPELESCLAIAEGGVAVSEHGLDFVFSCTEKADREPFPQKIVMLRSKDHAKSFEFVSTLLRAQDAAPLGASHFTAPSLLPSGGEMPLLLATPAIKTFYAGCVVIPFADLRSGQLFRDAKGLPVGLLGIKTLPGHEGGACAADRRLDTLLMNDLDPTVPKPFRILRRD
jgi:hypothetical protein